MSAADRRAYAYALGRFTASRETFDARAVASVAGMLADRRARCERFERKMKTWRGSFARRLARMAAAVREAYVICWACCTVSNADACIVCGSADVETLY